MTKRGSSIPVEKSRRAFRGGAWCTHLTNRMAAQGHGWVESETRDDALGFRCVRKVKRGKAAK